MPSLLRKGGGGIAFTYMYMWYSVERNGIIALTVDGVNTEFGTWVGGPQKILFSLVNIGIRILEVKYSTNNSLDKERVKISVKFLELE
jgi:hypothetical protein